MTGATAKAKANAAAGALVLFAPKYPISSFNRFQIEAAIKIFGLKCIDDHMGICLVHQFCNILDLITGNNGVQQADFLAAVSADAVNPGNAMPVLCHIGFDDLIRFGRRNLHGHTLVPVIEGINGLCGNKLEQNGVTCILPAKHKPENRNQRCIKYKDITPDGLAFFIGNIQRHKIHASGGRVAFQCDHCHNTVRESSKDHVQQNIVK